MKTYHFPSFTALANELQNDVGKEFTHYWQNPSYAASLPEMFRKGLPEGWDVPGRSGVSQAPKYLYRGEPGLYRNSLPSRGRLQADPRFSPADLKLLDELTSMAQSAWNFRLADRFRAFAWPQHYGFPTDYLDLTTDPGVALHFAALSSTNPDPPERAVYRIDLKAIIDKVYAPGGGWSPLQVASVEDIGCTRASRQRAWILCSREPEHASFDLQNSDHLGDHIEKFIIGAADGESYLQDSLLEAQDDVYANWPLAVVRSMKAVTLSGMPRAVAEWICNRIPLFEWMPLEVWYDGDGLGARLGLLTPTQAALQYGQDYRALVTLVIEELTSADIPTPNGILFGTLTGGEPDTSQWLLPGSTCEVQWNFPFPGPPRWNARAFEKVVLR